LVRDPTEKKRRRWPMKRWGGKKSRGEMRPNCSTGSKNVSAPKKKGPKIIHGCKQTQIWGVKKNSAPDRGEGTLGKNQGGLPGLVGAGWCGGAKKYQQKPKPRKKKKGFWKRLQEKRKRVQRQGRGYFRWSGGGRRKEVQPSAGGEWKRKKNKKWVNMAVGTCSLSTKEKKSKGVT